MPRPKRTKVVPSAPARAIPTPARVRKEPSDPIEDFASDNDDHPGEKRVKRAALELIDASHNISKLARTLNAPNLERDRVRDELKSSRDAAMSRLNDENLDTSDLPIASTEGDEDLSSQPVEVGRRTRGRAAETSSLVMGGFRRRSRQPSILGRGKKGRSSSVESELAESAGMINRPRKDNSIGPLGGARRRQRQPSILGRVPRARSSSIDLQTTSPLRKTGSVLGARRRERQPSILGTARKEKPVEKDYDMEDDFELEANDFEPEDESTPLQISRIRVGAETETNTIEDSQPLLSSGSRKRKAAELEASQPLSTAKRDMSVTTDIYSASDAPAPESLSPPEANDSTLDAVEAFVAEEAAQHPIEIADDESSDLDSLPSDLSLPPQLDHHEREEQDEQDEISSTMAPPHSSSSLEEEMVPPARGRHTTVRPQTSSRRTPAPILSDDDLPSSPPSLTHSPNRRAPAKKRTIAKSRNSATEAKSMSTAQLQALLPRRRPRVRDAFAFHSDEDDILDVSGLASDEDEISHFNVRPSRRPASSRKSGVATKRPVTRLKPSSKAKQTKTYASRKDQEREAEDDDHNDSLLPTNHADNNDEDEERNAPILGSEDSMALEERLGKELKRAKRKFENVDRWELEFEEISGRSSSPRERDAR